MIPWCKYETIDHVYISKGKMEWRVSIFFPFSLPKTSSDQTGRVVLGQEWWNGKEVPSHEAWSYRVGIASIAHNPSFPHDFASWWKDLTSLHQDFALWFWFANTRSTELLPAEVLWGGLVCPVYIYIPTSQERTWKNHSFQNNDIMWRGCDFWVRVGFTLVWASPA